MHDNRAVAAVFDRSAQTYDSVIPFFQTFGRDLVELANISSGGRVLDVAAGRGASAFPAAEQGARVVAVDLGLEMVRRLNEDIDGRSRTGTITALVADVYQLPFRGVFDVVLCGFLLHILPDARGAATELLRCLRPGGRVAVSYPTGGGEGWNFFGEVLRRHAAKAVTPLIRPPSPGDLAEALRGAGFDSVQVSDVTHKFVFEEPEVWWRWVWSHGMRAPLEHFDEAGLEMLRRDMLAAVGELQTSEGIVLHQSARFITASRP